MKRSASVLAFCLFFSAAVSAQTAQNLYSQYNRAEKAADWPAAEKIARLGMSRFPTESGFVTGLAWALRRQKKYAAALAVIEPAYRNKPEDANLRDNYAFALVDRGWEFNEKKDFQRAMDCFTKARAVLPADQWVINGYGYVLLHLDRKVEGIAVLERGLKDFPENAALKGNLVFGLLSAGWDAYNAKDPKGALVFFKKAFALAPGDEWALNAFGVGLRDTGELDRGIGVLEKGRARFPANNVLAGNLVWSYILKANRLKEDLKRSGNREPEAWAEAEAWYRKAGGVNKDDENYLLNYGGFLNDVHRYDEALACLEKGEKLYPADAYFKDNIQYALQEKERDLISRREYNAAATVIQEARARFPSEIWFAVDLTDVCFAQGDFSMSAEALVDLAGMKKPHEYRKPFAGDASGLVYFRLMKLIWKFAELRDFAAADTLVGRLAAVYPDAYFIAEARGVIAYQRGDTAQGIALVNRAYDRYIARHPEANVTLTLDLPLKGTYLVGGNNRADAITHAGLNRFCYDFSGADVAGATMKPGATYPGTSNRDYIGFGADIVSPVDGVVEEVVDLHDDLAPRAVPTPADGNSLTVKDDRGYHYVFVHNKKGSVRVSVGQRVKRGDKLAEIGNNGYSAQPHLHFGVYTPDRRVSVRVRFKSYSLFKNGKKTKVSAGIPQTGDVIGN